MNKYVSTCLFGIPSISCNRLNDRQILIKSMEYIMGGGRGESYWNLPIVFLYREGWVRTPRNSKATQDVAKANVVTLARTYAPA